MVDLGFEDWTDCVAKQYRSHTIQLRWVQPKDAKAFTEWRCATCDELILADKQWGFHLVTEHITKQEHMDKISLVLLAI